LLGLGIDELSAAALLVPSIKRAVQSLDIGVCRELAASALGSDSGAEILRACEALARERYGELLS
jgi:phosphoenolpyruvate-protein kinase (PTS system EI component)